MAAHVPPPQHDRGHTTQFVSGSNTDLTKVISFYSFSIGGTLSFPAYLTSFSDNYKSNWSTQELFGRMDPVSIYKNTTRQINFSIDIPSDNLKSSIFNFLNLKHLIEGLYPVYDTKVGGTTQISAPPFFRVLFSNMICKNATIDNNDPKTNGLLCYLDGFNFKPKLENGFYTFDDNKIQLYLRLEISRGDMTGADVEAVKSRLEAYRGSLIPRMMQADFNLNVIHEVPLGQYIAGDGRHTNRAANVSFATSFPNGIGDQAFKTLTARVGGGGK